MKGYVELFLENTPTKKRMHRRVVLTRWCATPGQVIYRYRGDVGRDPGTMDRNRMLTSSDFGSAMGVGRFKNRNQIFKDKFIACCEKIGIRPETLKPDPPKKYDLKNDCLEHGLQTEEYALEILSTILRVPVEKATTTYEIYTDGEHNFKLGSTPDGYVTVDGERSVVEVKCPYISESLLKKGLNEMDPDHWCQVQGQMAVTGLNSCYYAVYMSKGNQYSVKYVTKDQDFIQVMLYELFKLAMHIDQAVECVAKTGNMDEVLRDFKLITSKPVKTELLNYIAQRQKDHVRSLYHTDEDSVITVEAPGEPRS